MAETQVLSKGAEQGAGELWAVVGDQLTRDAVGGEETVQGADDFCRRGRSQLGHFNVAREIVHHDEV